MSSRRRADGRLSVNPLGMNSNVEPVTSRSFERHRLGSCPFAVANVLGRDATESEIYTARKLMPFEKFLYFRFLVDEIENRLTGRKATVPRGKERISFEAIH